MALRTMVVSQTTVWRTAVSKITLLAGPAIRAAAGRRRLIVGCRPEAHGVAPIATERAIGIRGHITQRATLRHAAGRRDMAGARRRPTPPGDLPVGITPGRNRPDTPKAADTPAVTVTPVAADTRTAVLIRNSWLVSGKKCRGHDCARFELEPVRTLARHVPAFFGSLLTLARPVPGFFQALVP
jgi:hypothetical protein